MLKDSFYNNYYIIIFFYYFYLFASLPPETIALAKKAVLAAEELPIVEGLLEESDLFNQAVALPAAKQRMSLLLKMDGQSREMERGSR